MGHLQKIRLMIQDERHDLPNLFLVLLLFLSFFILTFIGAGNFLLNSAIGVLLCLYGFAQNSVKADPWILFPLILYNLFSLFSGLRVYGDTLDGFASIQSVFTIIYLLGGCLKEKERTVLKGLCALWVAIMSVMGICGFVSQTFSGFAYRLSGLLGNPNAMGIILVLGWFAIQSLERDLNQADRTLTRFLNSMEFLILTALAMTLSIGSFAALATGIVAMKFHAKESFKTLFCRFAQTGYALACGVLLYIAGDFTNWPWLCLVICGYAFIAAWNYEEFKSFLNGHFRFSLMICLAGICGAGILLYLRPNAFATFMERIHMIRNGLRYMLWNPLLGVGPYQWRLLNLVDHDTYFNTWHIHNSFVHVGVELGWIALAMLIIIVIRCFFKKEDQAQYGAFVAMLVHNMMDTSFFYVSTVPLLMMTMKNDPKEACYYTGFPVKLMLAGYLIFFAWNTLQTLV